MAGAGNPRAEGTKLLCLKQPIYNPVRIAPNVVAMLVGARVYREQE